MLKTKWGLTNITDGYHFAKHKNIYSYWQFFDIFENFEGLSQIFFFKF